MADDAKEGVSLTSHVPELIIKMRKHYTCTLCIRLCDACPVLINLILFYRVEECGCCRLSDVILLKYTFYKVDE